MPKRQEIKEYPPNQECSICKGSCCKRLPGLYHPSDFSEPITKEFLTSLLLNKKAVVDWWERAFYQKPGFFLRPPCTNDNGNFLKGSWGGTCAFLAPEGCQLPFKNRPLGCRNLKPGDNPSSPCESTYGKYEAYIAWSRHRRLIEEVIDELITKGL